MEVESDFRGVCEPKYNLVNKCESLLIDLSFCEENSLWFINVVMELKHSFDVGINIDSGP